MAAAESADCGLERARPLSVRCDLSHLHSLERHRGRHRCLCVLAHGMAACLDSKMSIVSPLLSFSVQYPVTNPGSCETRGHELLVQRALRGLRIVDRHVDD